MDNAPTLLITLLDKNVQGAGGIRCDHLDTHSDLKTEYNIAPSHYDFLVVLQNHPSRRLPSTTTSSFFDKIFHHSHLLRHSGLNPSASEAARYWHILTSFDHSTELLYDPDLQIRVGGNLAQPIPSESSPIVVDLGLNRIKIKGLRLQLWASLTNGPSLGFWFWTR